MAACRLEPETRREWFVRLWAWVAGAWRPYLGWLVLLLCMGLSTLPALLLQENRWLISPALGSRLSGVGPLAIVAAWLVGGWRRPFCRQAGLGVASAAGAALPAPRERRPAADPGRMAARIW